MATETQAKASTKASGRSRITNGSKTIDGDGRSKWARRFRDVLALYLSDLGAPEDVSQMKHSLIRRAATMTVELERAEAEFAKKGKADPDALSAYQTTSNTLRRLLETLGMPAPATGRVGKDLEKRVEGGRVVSAVVATFSAEDWAICHGTADRDMARRVAFAVAEAVRTGKPLDPILAEFAVDAGLAAYGDTTAPVEPARHHIDLEPAAIQSAAIIPFKPDSSLL